MNEFKFACPVCGQHIKCPAEKSGSQMECPTCFRKLVVPQPPSEGSGNFVITASEVHTRTIPLPGSTAAAKTPVDGAQKKFPVVAVAVGALVLCAAAGVFIFRGKLFSSKPQTSVAHTGTDDSGDPDNTGGASAVPQPPPGDDKFWLTNLADMKIPDAPATGRVSGKGFMLQKAVIKAGQLDLRQGPKSPPDVGLTIYLYANQAEDLAGKSVNIEADRDKSPRAVLRTKNAEGKSVNEEFKAGYVMKLEFGAAANGKLPGKIYFCAPDAAKSYVMGTFLADIRKPSPPKKKP